MENIDLKVADYVASLPDDAERAKFRDGINAMGDAPAPELRKLATEAPQTMIVVSALANLALMHSGKTERALRRENEKRAVQAFEALTKGAEAILKEAGIALSPNAAGVPPGATD